LFLLCLDGFDFPACRLIKNRLFGKRQLFLSSQIRLKYLINCATLVSSFKNHASIKDGLVNHELWAFYESICLQRIVLFLIDLQSFDSNGQRLYIVIALVRNLRIVCILNEFQKV